MPEPAFPARARAHVAGHAEKLVRQDDAGMPALGAGLGEVRIHGADSDPCHLRRTSASRISFGRVRAEPPDRGEDGKDGDRDQDAVAS